MTHQLNPRKLSNIVAQIPLLLPFSGGIYTHLEEERTVTHLCWNTLAHFATETHSLVGRQCQNTQIRPL